MHRLPLKKLIVPLLAFLFSCSNTKDTFVSRTFHDLNAHYNGYYHAKLKVKDGVEKLAASHEDKYDRVLKLYQYADATKAKAVHPQMDEAMKKVSTVISRHSIVDRSGNEKPDSEKWIDDNWLVYGQAQFYKHDYFDALETFEYIESTYRNSPTRHLASLWIVKTYLELTQLSEAESKLDYLRNIKEFPKKQRGELEAVSADYYLQVRNYPKAIDHLNKAALLSKKKEDKVRFLFILAQVYQKQNELRKAFDTYTRCIKKNPKYEMEFNARINRARCYTPDNKNALDIRDELLKMEKDPKNKEYLDQVYYALAGLAQKEKKEVEAVDYLGKSIKASTGNAAQKALTYLELGKIYLARHQYRLAQAYYDSCVTNIPDDHPDHELVVAKRNSLTRLVKNLNTIEREDSLQRLAKMDPSELNKMVEGIVKKEDQEQEKKKEDEKQVNQIFGNKQSAPQAGGGSWYFYNSSAMSFGFNDFAKKWGTRRLEDNWRRSQKEQEQQNIEETQEADKTAEADTGKSNAADAMASRKTELTKNLPSTPELVEKSNNKIVEAYYSAALIYKEQLDDPKASAEMLEELLSRFPHCKYELQSYFQLYRLYAKLGNQQKSDHFKNIILNEHADSEYAQIILNPNYAAEKANQKSKLEQYYEETYRKFLNGEYTTVIQRRAEADKEFPQNPLMPKFDLLKTLSIGRTQSVPVFEASLQDIVRNYSDDPVKDQAQEILDYIHSLNETKAAEIEEALQKDSITRGKYVYTPDSAHYVMVIIPISGFNAADLQTKIADFIIKYFNPQGYQTLNRVLDSKKQFILVQTFENKNVAWAFADAMNNNDEVYGNTDPGIYQQLLISAESYSVLMKDRNLSDYMDFYYKFYK